MAANHMPARRRAGRALSGPPAACPSRRRRVSRSPHRSLAVDCAGAHHADRGHAEESPTFGGYSWPEVGQYEKIAGNAYGEVNPLDPQNAVIVDIELAPRNARGNVEYSFNFYILKPIDLKKGADKMMYEPPNRGGKTWNTFGRVAGAGDDPGRSPIRRCSRTRSSCRAATRSCGAAGRTAAGADNPTSTPHHRPGARNPGGTPITGPSYEYIVVGATRRSR